MTLTSTTSLTPIAWNSSLPQGWSVARLRWLAQIYAGGTPSRDDPSYWSDGTIPWVNSGAVNDWAITSPSEYITETALRGSSARWIPAGSVLVALAGQGRTKGMAARLEFPSTCNQSMAAIIPGERLEYRYLQYWLTANYENLRNLAGGDLRDGLNLQLIGDIRCPVPSLREQRRIADFLDDQVARINRIVAARRAQHDLLREANREHLRNTVVDLACTNANARLGLFATIRSGDFLPTQQFDASGEYAVVGGNGVAGTHTVFNTLPPALAIGRVGALCGNVHELSDPAWVTDNALIVKVDRLNTTYVAMILTAAELNSLASRTAQPLLTGEVVKGIPIPLANADLQMKVSAAWAERKREMSEAATALDRSKNLFEGLLRSLITAAVTGSVDLSMADGSQVSA